VTALVRDFDSAYWNVFISANHADAALEAVMARSRSELTATEKPMRPPAAWPRRRVEPAMADRRHGEG
jgi:hypothetical protein